MMQLVGDDSPIPSELDGPGAVKPNPRDLKECTKF